jgi:hypothetical protein
MEKEFSAFFPLFNQYFCNFTFQVFVLFYTSPYKVKGKPEKMK